MKNEIILPLGFAASGISADIKQSGKKDVAVIFSETPTVSAAAFTENTFAATPVLFSKKILEDPANRPQAIVVNSGNANACTGTRGEDDTVEMAEVSANALRVETQQVFICSTGIIGEPMPMQKIVNGINKAVLALSETGLSDAAEAIMTTDIVPKIVSETLNIGNKKVTISGIAKGAGMIAPDMKTKKPHATMLAFILTDADVNKELLDYCVENSLDQSFNRITIDGDTSTNDTFIAMANGMSEIKTLKLKKGLPSTQDAEKFYSAFCKVASTLARKMILDAEGATKFINIKVSGAASKKEAKKCAKTIGNSLLCKTAWFGADPNWGRILDAAGYSGVKINTKKINLAYDDVPVVKNGLDAGTSSEDLINILKHDEFTIFIDLAAGNRQFTLWTCDLSYDYVKINAEYHT
ncbi:MAG: bifunctional glutamate N-acetyltransferase/amino-acid acetyltransferase ArgJ [Verrucomicrobiota bacterium]|nr:bifunctional glutamate N-acetyltransferase/amino-acid acetyltransferase ArgJ [Verrucomicrobiota bacterium]